LSSGNPQREANPEERRKNVRYEKPTIARLGVASNAIQHSGIKMFHNVTDAQGSDRPLSTGNAYDLDE
jgi:hypothetical protein